MSSIINKTVLVTGASSGIGLAVIEKLFSENYQVVATVRSESSKQELLRKFKDIRVLLLDFQKPSDFANAFSQLRTEYGIHQLYGIVNNAGVANGGPFLYQDMSEIEEMIQVNLTSLILFTHQALPFLMAAGNSRIVNISSISAVMCTPFLAGYAASKSGVDAFSDSIRKELAMLGIKVCVVAPGSIKTPIWQKGLVSVGEKYSTGLYGAGVQKFMKFAKFESENGLEASVVAEDVFHALTAKNPKIKYFPVPRKLVSFHIPLMLPKVLNDFLMKKALFLNPPKEKR